MTPPLPLPCSSGQRYWARTRELAALAPRAHPALLIAAVITPPGQKVVHSSVSHGAALMSPLRLLADPLPAVPIAGSTQALLEHQGRGFERSPPGPFYPRTQTHRREQRMPTFS